MTACSQQEQRGRSRRRRRRRRSSSIQAGGRNRLAALASAAICLAAAFGTTGADVDVGESESELSVTHPDPNDEDHPAMVYIGRTMDDGDGADDDAVGSDGRKKKRLGFDVDNGIKYIFGTGFDETHREIEEEDLRHEHYGPNSDRDVPDRARGKTRERVLHEKRAGKLDLSEGPKPFGWFKEHPLDGGAVPPRVVHVEPFFLDEVPVTNREFGKFVRATMHDTEAETFGWSFVLSSFLPDAEVLETANVDPEAEDWVAADGAYWRRPEGPGTSYKYREDHPVVHVSHKDAAEYCKWVGKRLPGEREWEAAARAGRYGPKNRTLYVWGDEPSVSAAKDHANLWGDGAFPWENRAEDGWRATSPVRTYPPNDFGMYDLTGNVWEWMRGGKHKARIVRGGSYVDGLDGSFNHAATLGARATLHGTTTTGNVGFRCAKAPRRGVQHHYVYENSSSGGGDDSPRLTIENQDGSRKYAPRRRSSGGDGSNVDDDDEDEFRDEDEEDEYDPTNPRPGERRGRKKVPKQRMRTSDEL